LGSAPQELGGDCGRAANWLLGDSKSILTNSQQNEQHVFTFRLLLRFLEEKHRTIVENIVYSPFAGVGRTANSHD
jgi:hypothetical protein